MNAALLLAAVTVCPAPCEYAADATGPQVWIDRDPAGRWAEVTLLDPATGAQYVELFRYAAAARPDDALVVAALLSSFAA